MDEKTMIDDLVKMLDSGMMNGVGHVNVDTEAGEQSKNVPAMGFNGIAAAFLGGLNPIGAVFSSYFIQHITNGGAYVDKTLYCAQISDFISAVIIYLCGFVFFFKIFMNRMLDRRDERRVKGSQKGGEA